LFAPLDSGGLLIVDEPGYAPLLQTGAELLFDVFSGRRERGATINDPAAASDRDRTLARETLLRKGRAIP